MTHYSAIITVLSLLLAPTLAAGVEGDEAVEHGKLLFRIHCQTCHGESGAGDGPAAAGLSETPADLRQLKPAGDGRFDRERIARVIDGREEIPSHGSRAMPVWGLSLQDPASVTNQERDVAESIRDIVRFIESIQQ
jgi:mono/diheme cytochrome c family protein